MLNIVITEDDPDDQVLIQEAFRKANVSHELMLANDGVELLEHLEKHGAKGDAARPDLVLLDLNMPRLGGREALETIKNHAHWRSIPVVVLTTSSDEQDILNSYMLGANSYIRKPVKFTDLMKIVAHLNRYWSEMVELPPHGAGGE